MLLQSAMVDFDGQTNHDVRVNHKTPSQRPAPSSASPRFPLTVAFRQQASTCVNCVSEYAEVGHVSIDTAVLGANVSDWTCEDVARWLCANGFEKYASLIAVKHKVDGKTLMMLNENDLREKPLELKCLGDIKRLGSSILFLRNHKHACDSLSSEADQSTSPQHQCFILPRKKLAMESISDNGDSREGFANARCYVTSKTSEEWDACGDNISNAKFLSHSKRIQILSREDLIRKVESPDTKLKSLIKMGIAFGYCTLSLLITAYVMVLVHDRVPDMKTYPPLPDIVLENLPLIPWAFEVCELIGVCLATVWLTILFFHKHRVIVLRRMFSLVGTVFLLRCVTMLITSLSVPGLHLECSSKSYGSFSNRLKEAFHIWSHFGMSIQGVRSCGDYMFSGHTTVITLLNHFITEYTPDTWYGLHTITWVLNLFGIFFILAGHEHYSIDVFIAFYISSRMFLYYHAYAYHQYSPNNNDNRMRIWFPLGWFFEAGSQGRVFNEFDLPISIPVINIASWNLNLKFFGRRNIDKKSTQKVSIDIDSNVITNIKHGRRRKNCKK